MSRVYKYASHFIYLGRGFNFPARAHPCSSPDTQPPLSPTPPLTLTSLTPPSLPPTTFRPHPSTTAPSTVSPRPAPHLPHTYTTVFSPTTTPLFFYTPPPHTPNSLPAHPHPLDTCPRTLIQRICSELTRAQFRPLPKHGLGGVRVHVTSQLSLFGCSAGCLRGSSEAQRDLLHTRGRLPCR